MLILKNKASSSRSVSANHNPLPGNIWVGDFFMFN
nr:MAG TPA: Protein of unknown function (DUF4087) [Caudoviricetes sp.]